MEIFDISLLTVRQTLSAIALPTKPRSISEEQARQFALARWLLEIEGHKLSEVRKMFESGLELGSDLTVAGIAAEIARAKQGLSMSDVAREFGLSLSTVRHMLEKLGLSSRRYFDSEAVARFAEARGLKASKLDNKGETRLSWQETKERNDSEMSKQQLCQQYGLSLLTVRQTIKSAGLSTSQQRYSPQEAQRFAQARRYLEQGWSYRKVAERMGSAMKPMVEVNG